MQEVQQPLIEFGVLKSRTIRLLLFSSFLSSAALQAPLLFLATGKMPLFILFTFLTSEAEISRLSSDQIVDLYTFIGLGWMLGCFTFGLLVIR